LKEIEKNRKDTLLQRHHPHPDNHNHQSTPVEMPVVFFPVQLQRQTNQGIDHHEERNQGSRDNNSLVARRKIFKTNYEKE
jgi:hypothetical protein